MNAHPLQNSLTLANLVAFGLLYHKFDHTSHWHVARAGIFLSLVQTTIWSLQFFNTQPIIKHDGNYASNLSQILRDDRLFMLPLKELFSAQCFYFLQTFALYFTIFEMQKYFKVGIVEWLNLSMVSTQFIQNVADIFLLFVQRLKNGPSDAHALRGMILSNGLSIINVIGTAMTSIYFSNFRIELPLKDLRRRRTRGFSDSRYPILMRPTSPAIFVLIEKLLHDFFYHSILEPKLNSMEISTRRKLMFTSIYYDVSVGCYGLYSYLACIRRDDVFATAREFEKNALVIKGYRGDDIIKLLNRYIPTMAWLSGVIFGSIIEASDILTTSTSTYTGNLDDSARNVSASNIIWSTITIANAYKDYHLKKMQSNHKRSGLLKFGDIDL